MSVIPISAPRTYRVMYGALPAKRTAKMPLWMVFLVPLLVVLLPILAVAAYVCGYGWDTYACIGILVIGAALVPITLILASGGEV